MILDMFLLRTLETLVNNNIAPSCDEPINIQTEKMQNQVEKLLHRLRRRRR